jgi:hypothetical protein
MPFSSSPLPRLTALIGGRAGRGAARRSSAHRSAAAGFLAAGLLLSACDSGVVADSYTLSLSDDGRHVVVEQEWSLPLGSDKGDITFNRAEVAPGNVVASTLSNDEQVVLLTSTYDERIGGHRVDIEIDGINVNRAELFFQGFDQTKQLAAAAEDVIDLPEPEVRAPPQSFHYSYVEDDNGNQVLIVTYDYHGGGANGSVRVGGSGDESEARVTAARGEAAPRNAPGRAAPGVLTMEVEHVGYRLVLDEPAPAWSRLRVSGYDELAIERASFVQAGGAPAPVSALRRTVLASDVKASLAARR